MRFLPLSWLRAVLSPRCPLRPSLRLLVLALVRHANTDGEAWPGRALLGAETGLSLSTVKRSLRELEARGVVVLAARGGGRGRTSRWRLEPEPPAALHAPRIFETGSPRAPRKGVVSASRKGFTVTDRTDQGRELNPPAPARVPWQEVLAFTRAMGAA